MIIALAVAHVALFKERIYMNLQGGPHVLCKEQAAEQESHDLSRKLKSTKGTEDFPLESVMELLGKCWEAGLAAGQYLEVHLGSSKWG